jgi:TnsA endonuclease N terminal
MGRMLQWESTNEHSAFRLLDCDPDVLSFTEQPCEIRYIEDGVVKSHYPDILVEIQDRRELWEVKPASKAMRPEIATRSALLAQHLPSWGYVYRVVTDHDLAKQPRLNNAVQLLHFGQRNVTEREQEFVRLLLRKRGSLVWSDACNGIYGARGREILCRLVLNGNLVLDMDTALSPQSTFSAGKAGL